MTDKILALLAYAALFGFVAILMSYVGHIDLIVVIVVVLVMAAVDFILLNRSQPDR